MREGGRRRTRASDRPPARPHRLVAAEIPLKTAAGPKIHLSSKTVEELIKQRTYDVLDYFGMPVERPTESR